MNRDVDMVLLPLLVTLIMLPGPQQAPPAQDDPSNQAASAASAALDVDATGVSLDRIQRAVTHPPAITLSEMRPVFRVEVFGTKPTIEDILGPDYLKGPVPYGGMTHQEFLDMVTPPEVRGYAPFSNREGMVVAATSVALQWAVQKAMDKVKDARTERAKREAQQEVDDALKALDRARRAAGLSDR